MSVFKHLPLLAIISIALTACSGGPVLSPECTSVSPCNNSISNLTTGEEKDIEIIDVVPRDPIIVNATGYSAPISRKNLSKSQARLMSLRGSKLDAYRNLAERVYGLKIDGTSSISNMMTTHDELRTYVDAYLVGAKVVSQRELEDGTFETVVEMALQENFRQCVSSPSSILSNPACQVRPRYNTSSSSQSGNSATTSLYTVE
ncbi:hypothetical protein GV054_03375 [Marinomonas mediterranea]|jgi:Uncharacterized protein conserved in bacteria|uniref:Lipoprotein LPP20-like domain-containing protein n=1 Tax=Marinomonas mediterranea (strain ATCC 700492 / JCM 21426 / NBRC 103028 / MMB-1) TaxID=717774 RepID=F2K1V0_MARM1|nr:LPP20 family lipoprotein [Marinomonas mediterranea]ADZ89944.1 protein of unknown function DUF400 [Marinomonas mediterranea MMB-1]WCN12117.1 hypothetical protein GV054_03375 [Marinomonas mediterranea]WCN16154.1 hypothetical protein GV053_03305 [Marinomonas mediterranea MMB-1]